MSHLQGIIWANFGHKRGTWKPCLMAYHSHYYIVPLEKDPLPHNLCPQETESLEEMEETKAIGWEVTEQKNKELKEMFTSARPGDHFMTPFQCEVCHFRSIYKREPVQSSTPDGWALACMVRANIDAFWSCRPSTVKGNLQEVNRIMQQANQLGIMSPMFGFDHGPLPLRDTTYGSCDSLVAKVPQPGQELANHTMGHDERTVDSLLQSRPHYQHQVRRSDHDGREMIYFHNQQSN
ncbi:hypothetical protein ACA910_005685 [Epithemia clementina (nom. ined.)]